MMKTAKQRQRLDKKGPTAKEYIDGEETITTNGNKYMMSKDQTRTNKKG
jgi:hypothetical protein